MISIIAARNESLLFWEDRMREVSDELIVTTDDGSRGRQCLVTEPLKELCEAGGIDLAPPNFTELGTSSQLRHNLIERQRRTV